MANAQIIWRELLNELIIIIYSLKKKLNKTLCRRADIKQKQKQLKIARKFVIKLDNDTECCYLAVSRVSRHNIVATHDNKIYEEIFRSIALALQYQCPALECVASAVILSDTHT